MSVSRAYLRIYLISYYGLRLTVNYCMCAFYERGIHVALYDYENIRKALLAEDELAIVESGGDTRYAGHHGAFESIFLSDIGSRYTLLKDFVRWNRLPILRPREYLYNPIVKDRL